MRQSTLLLLAALALATTSSACSVLVDGAIQDRDTGVGIDVDLPTSFCETPGVSDGDYCNIEGSLDLRLCIDTLCVRSSCGDGFVDDRTDMPPAGDEECDDGNDISDDGCEADCTLSCSEAADCDDMNPCTDDTCRADSTCGNAPNTAMCMLAGTQAMCVGGVCPLGCGNGVIGVDETCDDGNAISGDGCERDCTPTCTMDEQCEDGIACNGVATCGPVGTPGPGARRCVPGTPTACADDGDRCTTERCEDGVGCVSDGSANDVDMDGHFARSCGGDDCDDTNAARHPGLVEVCGNTIDDDCSERTPDNTQTAYFVDCDRDGFATSMSGSMSVCMRPPTPPSACAGGSWTTVSPLNPASTDCAGSNTDVNPRQSGYFSRAISGAPLATDFDYNCDGVETPQYASGSLYFCVEFSAGFCSGTTHYTAAPVCGMSNRVNRCTRNIRGTCSFEASASAPVACR